MNRLKENYLNKLKSSVESNLDKYYVDKPFIEEFEELLGEESVELYYNRLVLETQTINIEKLDYENSTIIYKSLSHLPLAEVADERIWAFMTHITHWDYMRKRWPIEETMGSAVNFILNRYFFRERPFSRNGLARLWWFAHITYNSKFENPFYLTSIMLQNQDQDIARMILETPTICRNRKMVEATLISLKELTEEYEVKSRDYIRFVARYINLTGSVRLWDYLDESELREIIEEIKNSWKKTQNLQASLF
ncbi:DUF6339 family protein [Evansella tamaricis]|uniref:Uncharacterized protein n=1 Tax=Evansella tamaricis TaxID=2069301 RepID=A0ABS6JKK0_9BACI|nr:DUF6339 family protein [Evansella tamaricis]MBU9714116.1 hypothetical protein [Evansella tamaricis]